jgi:DHA1 family bicyclomycin/chloramphenicol resistance-like MFS transporter
MSGTASSFLGVARFAFGGLAAPLVGLGSGVTPLALVAAAGTLLATVTYALTVRSPGKPPVRLTHPAAGTAETPTTAIAA